MNTIFSHQTGYLFFDEINTFMELVSRGKSLIWKSVRDNSRAVEVLEYFGAIALT